MTALLERTETRMARSWTVAEVLEGWARHYEAMLEGRLSPVRLPTGKQPSYHKGSRIVVDLDFGAWARVEGFGFRDVEIRRAISTGVGDVVEALAADLARCPYPCEEQSKDPIPEGWEFRGGRWVPSEAFLEAHVRIGNVWVKRSPEMREGLRKRLSTTGRAIAARLYSKRRKGE